MSHPDRFLLAGVMGSPVMHSRSPRIHNYWFEKYGLVGTYLPLAIEQDGLEAALRALPSLAFSGCNLTIPHKEAALAIVDEVDPLARRIGAVNCVIVRKDKSLAGLNHDGWGFIQSILEVDPGWEADRGPIVVMGAGGSSRSVLVSLADQGAREIRLINRSPERALNLALEFGAPVRAIAWEDRHDALDGAAMLINTTSQGMVGQPALVSDIIYIPRETPLLM